MTGWDKCDFAFLSVEVKCICLREPVPETASLAQWLRRPPRGRKIRGSNPACDGILPGRVKPVTLKNCTPVATTPGAWHYRVSTGTGRPSVSILWLGEVESLICNFSVWQHVQFSEQIRPWDTLACCRDVQQPTNQPTNKPVPEIHLLVAGTLGNRQTTIYRT